MKPMVDVAEPERTLSLGKGAEGAEESVFGRRFEGKEVECYLGHCSGFVGGGGLLDVRSAAVECN